MKKYFLLPLFVGFLALSCTDNNIVEPVSTDATSQSVSELKWLDLPQFASNRLMKVVSASKLITGSVGGKIDVECKIENSKAYPFLMKASLDVPPNAFDGSQTLLFTVILDDQTMTATFSPSPMTFKVPLSLDLEYSGIDLSTIDQSRLNFAYLAGDGSIQVASYQKLDVNTSILRIRVKSAKIEHFSRFGFVQ
ncbi:MAG: hypothetical protein FJ214_03700 [Ignavibacteria bacterium]|nr:hypothetical protein [Ignavibacteria bacterium]